MAASEVPLAISVRDLVVGFGDRIVLDNLSLDVRRGEILGLVGGSGSGKSVLMRTIIGLVEKRQGAIEVLGVDLDAAADAERRRIERRWGVLFQHGALFLSLTVKQNEPATFSGMDGVQVRMSYRNERGASFDQLVFAAAEEKTVLLFEYQALSRVYFDRDLPAFQSIMGSFKDLSAGRTTPK